MAPKLTLGIKHVANTPKWLAITMLSVFFGCSAAYGIIEHKGPVESMWWAVVTGATVGYGDQYPATTAGRFVGAVLIVSFFWLAIFAGAQITANLVADPHIFTDEEQKEMQGRLKTIETMLGELLSGDLQPVEHRIIINSISDLSNEDLRTIIKAHDVINKA